MSNLQTRIIKVAHAQPELRKTGLVLVANFRKLLADPTFKRGLEKGFVDAERAFEITGRARAYDLIDGLYYILASGSKAFIFDPNERLTSSDLTSLPRQLKNIFQENYGIMDAGDYDNSKRVEGDKLARQLDFDVTSVKGRTGAGYRVIPNAALAKLLNLYGK